MAYINLFPATQSAIETPLNGPPDAKGVYRCGCQHKGENWWLCAYHEGYEDALDDESERLRHAFQDHYQATPVRESETESAT